MAGWTSCSREARTITMSNADDGVYNASFPASQLWRNTGSGFTNVTATVAPGLPGVPGRWRGAIMTTTDAWISSSRDRSGQFHFPTVAEHGERVHQRDGHGRARPAGSWLRLRGVGRL